MKNDDLESHRLISIPRDETGEFYRSNGVDRIYLPRYYPTNGDYILPSRNASIINGLLDWNTNNKLANYHRKLQNRLMTYLGFSRKAAEIFSKREVSRVRRAEQQVHGVIDSLLLASPLFFDEQGKTCSRTLHKIVRNILQTSMFNEDLVVTMWKEYTNHIWVRVTRMKTIEEAKLSSNNIFSRLSNLPPIQHLLSVEELSKRDLTMLGHLISTRQFPCAGKKTEIKSLQTFYENSTRDFVWSEGGEADLKSAAYSLGKECRKAGPGAMSKAHISLSQSASYLKSKAEGGRLQEILDDLKPFLLTVPVKDERYDLITTCYDVAYLPRWRTWCREFPLLSDPELTLGDPIPGTYLGVKDVYLKGYDKAMGMQIINLAYMRYKSHKGPVPVKVLTVPEPGGKARVVTTGPWWLQILEMPVGHVTRAYLAQLPEARSGMTKADHSWQYMYMLNYARKCPKEFPCLSSDLKEATDRIPHAVAATLFNSFMEGLGLATIYHDITLDLLLRGRQCHSRERMWETKCGVLMGEPIARTILVLFAVCMERIAYQKYLSSPFKEHFIRAYAVAGDDHIAYGPQQYLDEITSQYLRYGACISKEKHGTSRRAVKYCERVIDVSKIHGDWQPRNLHRYEDYLRSPRVFTFKVRLVSPHSRVVDSQDESNSAISKGRDLSKYLYYAQAAGYSPKEISLVRDRFFQRMGPMMPERTSSTYWHLFLPPRFGGLNLRLPDGSEDEILCQRIPSFTKSLIIDVANGKKDEEVSEFRKFLTKRNHRGVLMSEKDEEDAQGRIINMILPNLTTRDFKDLCQDFGIEFSAQSTRFATQPIFKAGWRYVKDVITSFQRPILFKSMLSGDFKPRLYKTVPLKERFNRVYDHFYKGECTLELETLRTALQLREPQQLVWLGPSYELEENGKFRKFNLLSEVLEGLPDLNLWWDSFGVLT